MYQVRLLEVTHPNDITVFRPQQKGLFFWHTFKDEQGWNVVFHDKEAARNFLKPFRNVFVAPSSSTVVE